MCGLPLCVSLAYNREKAREMSERVGCWSIRSECQSQESCDYNSKRMCTQTAERLPGSWPLSDDVFFFFFFSDLSHKGGLARAKTAELRLSDKT